MVIGAMTVLLALATAWFGWGWGQWKRYDDPIVSPSKRYEVSHAVVLYPRVRFGLVMADRETGREEVLAGWTRGFERKDVTWTADDRLLVRYTEQNSLDWGRRTELFGVTIDWVP